MTWLPTPHFTVEQTGPPRMAEGPRMGTWVTSPTHAFSSEPQNLEPSRSAPNQEKQAWDNGHCSCPPGQPQLVFLSPWGMQASITREHPAIVPSQLQGLPSHPPGLGQHPAVLQTGAPLSLKNKLTFNWSKVPAVPSSIPFPARASEPRRGQAVRQESPGASPLLPPLPASHCSLSASALSVSL